MIRVDRVHVRHPLVELGVLFTNMIPQDGPLYRVRPSAVPTKESQ